MTFVTLSALLALYFIILCPKSVFVQKMCFCHGLYELSLP